MLFAKNPPYRFESIIDGYIVSMDLGEQLTLRSGDLFFSLLVMRTALKILLV